MDFETPPAEILMVSELATQLAKYADRHVRVVGSIITHDPSQDLVVIGHDEATVRISTKLLGPLACQAGQTWHFIGSVEPGEHDTVLVAKIGSFLKDLDLRFFFEALKVRRKCLADLDETADAMAAAAAMSQSQFE